MRLANIIAATLACILLSACSQLATVPTDARQDKAPIIKLNATTKEPPSGYAGDIEPSKETVATNATVKVTRGATIVLLASGSNPGGVMNLSVSAMQGAVRLFDASTAATKTADGKVQTQLIQLKYGMPPGQPMLVKVDAPVTLTVSATNFNSMSTTIAVTYVPADFELSFTATPSTIGFQHPSSATLNWETLYGHPPYVVSLVPATGTASVASLGSVSVSPAASTTYVYTIKDQNSSLSKSVFVEVVQPPSPPKITKLTSSPNDGYNPLGTVDTITWHVDNCTLPDCNVTLKGDGTGYADTEHTLIMHLDADGKTTYKPIDTTNFVLTADSPFGASKPKKLQLSISPSQQPQPTGQTTYYFTVLDNNANATWTCAWIAVTATSEANAEKIALSNYGMGYSIGKQLNASDFNAHLGCN